MTERYISLGKISVLYEHGFLRYLKVGELEIVRMIYFASRDQLWETLPLNISNEQISLEPESFNISYDAVNTYEGTDLIQWNVRLSGNSEGLFNFEISGEVLQEFKRNRVGICVLHPAQETLDRPAQVVHSDGSITSSNFPKHISPHQVFRNITKLNWQLDHGLNADLNFEGDIFETEDQRNWMDASFKTYSTPLDIPYPVTLAKNQKVHQKVTLRISGVEESLKSDQNGNDPIEISIDPSTVTSFPKIGSCCALKQPQPDNDLVVLLKALSFHHLRIDLNLAKSNWEGRLKTGLAEAALLEVPIQFAIQFGEDPGNEWSSFMQQLQTLHPDKLNIGSVTLYSSLHRSTPNDLMDVIIPKVRQTFPDALVGGGSDIYFTELNRSIFNSGKVDYVSYALNPQVHAKDDKTLVENMEGSGHIVKSALRLTNNKPQFISPVTLRPRFNPNADSDGSGRDLNKLPYEVDPRQPTLFAASWTLGCLKYLSESGVQFITLYETHGMNGYLMGRGDFYHRVFSMQRTTFPIYDLIKGIQEFRPNEVIRSVSSQPLTVTSLVLRNENETLIAIANHTPETKKVRVQKRVYDIKGYEIKFFKKESGNKERDQHQ